MRVLGRPFAYSVQGRKVDELNKKYPKTQKYYVEVQKNAVNDGYIRIHASGSSMRGISIPYWNVREYKEEGGEV